MTHYASIILDLFTFLGEAYKAAKANDSARFIMFIRQIRIYCEGVEKKFQRPVIDPTKYDDDEL